jgi:hypothetical protein
MSVYDDLKDAREAHAAACGQLARVCAILGYSNRDQLADWCRKATDLKHAAPDLFLARLDALLRPIDNGQGLNDGGAGGGVVGVEVAGADRGGLVPQQ